MSDSPWQWDVASGTWKKRGGENNWSGQGVGEAPVFIDRVLRIPLQELRRGDSNLDIVFSRGDSLLVERVGYGNIYIDGEMLAWAIRDSCQ